MTWPQATCHSHTQHTVQCTNYPATLRILSPPRRMLCAPRHQRRTATSAPVMALVTPTGPRLCRYYRRTRLISINYRQPGARRPQKKQSARRKMTVFDAVYGARTDSRNSRFRVVIETKLERLLAAGWVWQTGRWVVANGDFTESHWTQHQTFRRLRLYVSMYIYDSIIYRFLYFSLPTSVTGWNSLLKQHEDRQGRYICFHTEWLFSSKAKRL